MTYLLAPANILNPLDYFYMNSTRHHSTTKAYQSIQDIVGCLHTSGARVHEHGAQKVDLLNDIKLFVDLDSVANVVRMLDEQEDDACQDLLHTCANKPT